MDASEQTAVGQFLDDGYTQDTLPVDTDPGDQYTPAAAERNGSYQATISEYNTHTAMDAFTVLDVGSSHKGEHLHVPYLALTDHGKYYVDGTDAATGNAFATLLDDGPHREHHKWEGDLLNLLTAAYDASEVEIDTVQVEHVGGAPAAVDDRRTRATLYDGGEELLSARSDHGILLGAVADADIQVADALLTDLPAAAEQVNLRPLDISDYAPWFQDLDAAAAYRADAAAIDGETTPLTDDGVDRPRVEPYGGRTDISGFPDTLTTGDTPDQLVFTGDGHHLTVPFATTHLSEAAYKRYKRETGSNAAAHHAVSYDRISEAQWPTIVDRLLDGESTAVAGLADRGHVSLDDRDGAGPRPAVTAPEELYVTVEDTPYPAPAHQFQTLALATDMEISLLEDDPEPGTDPAFQ